MHRSLNHSTSHNDPGWRWKGWVKDYVLAVGRGACLHHRGVKRLLQRYRDRGHGCRCNNSGREHARPYSPHVRSPCHFESLARFVTCVEKRLEGRACGCVDNFHLLPSAVNQGNSIFAGRLQPRSDRNGAAVNGPRKRLSPKPLDRGENDAGAKSGLFAKAACDGLCANPDLPRAPSKREKLLVKGGGQWAERSE